MRRNYEKKLFINKLNFGNQMNIMIGFCFERIQKKKRNTIQFLVNIRPNARCDNKWNKIPNG